MAKKIDLDWVDVLGKQPDKQQLNKQELSLLSNFELALTRIELNDDKSKQIVYYREEQIKDVAQQLGIQEKLLESFIAELALKNKLVKYQDNFYKISPHQAICEVQIRQAKNGTPLGFAKPLNHFIHDDVFITPAALAYYYLIDGDVVLAEYTKGGKGLESDQLAIISPLNVQKVGYLLSDSHHSKSTFTFTYSNGSLTERININNFNIPGKEALGKLVVVDLNRSINLEGGVELTTTLVKTFATNNEIEENQLYSSLKFNLDIEFTPENLAKARSYGETIPSDALTDQRIDLTKLPLVTIDGEDARDFDDAVYVEKNKSQFRLVVAIADVSYYVRENDPIDKQAKIRTTSVYFPNKVIPMLPQELSNELCSLKPNVKRLSLVADINIDRFGNILDYKFYNAVIKSHGRLTYTQVQSWKDNDFTNMEDYVELKQPIQNLFELYALLIKQRQKRGTINLESEEVLFTFDAQGEVNGLKAKGRVDAHKLIEEMMIAANVASALFVSNNKFVAPYRNHQKPKEERVSKLAAYLSTLGVVLPNSDNPSPKDYSKAIDQINKIHAEKGLPIEAINLSILRSMSQAVYSADNIGHFGLALSHYSHFTSPIRRYPDLMLHRVIKSILAKGDPKLINNWGAKSYQVAELEQLCEKSSFGERNADAAVYDFIAWLKARYLQLHLGETFIGTVSSVTGFGVFVTIPEMQIEGLLHIHNFPANTRINIDLQRLHVGNKHLSLGDKIAITVANVNLEQRKIDFSLANSTDALIASGNLAEEKQITREQNFSSSAEDEKSAKDKWLDLSKGYADIESVKDLVNKHRPDTKLSDLELSPLIKGDKESHNHFNNNSQPLSQSELQDIIKQQQKAKISKPRVTKKTTSKDSGNKEKKSRRTPKYKN